MVGFVISLIVSLPIISKVASPILLNLVEQKEIFGYFSASKKSALFKWASLFLSLVSMESTFAVKENTAFSKSSCASAVPLISSKRPVIVAISRCFILKNISECEGSISHFIVSMILDFMFCSFSVVIWDIILLKFKG